MYYFRRSAPKTSNVNENNTAPATGAERRVNYAPVLKVQVQPRVSTRRAFTSTGRPEQFYGTRSNSRNGLEIHTLDAGRESV